MIAKRNSVALTPITSDTKQFITLEGGYSEITPELIRNSILSLETAMSGLPGETKLGLETMHNFTDGIYIRTVYMRAGSLITGKIHKLEHTVIVSKGRASIVSEDTGAREITAPMIFISPPGVKRLLFIREDMIFTTVHPNPTNTRDLAQLEAALMIESYEALEKESV